MTFVGRASPYIKVRSLAALPRGSVLVDLGGADNVLPRTECALDVRAWLDARRGEVSSPPCLRRQRIRSIWKEAGSGSTASHRPV